MKKRTPISAIMTQDVITLNHKDNLETAEHLFKTKHIRHIPVVSQRLYFLNSTSNNIACNSIPDIYYLL